MASLMTAVLVAVLLPEAVAPPSTLELETVTLSYALPMLGNVGGC
jgi:hypothetical protein